MLLEHGHNRCPDSDLLSRIAEQIAQHANVAGVRQLATSTAM